uniref:Nuclear transport factor 2 family protein n=1 Tax=Ascaris lumbricoides TaxID=6252 RepID=A0A0M3IFL3_ASCLU
MQPKPQQQTLETVLESMVCQQQTLLERVTRMFATIGPIALPASTIEFANDQSNGCMSTHILPDRASKVSLEDIVKTLKESFEHNALMFASRYLKTQHNGDSRNDYTGIINQCHGMVEFKAITPE